MSSAWGTRIRCALISVSVFTCVTVTPGDLRADEPASAGQNPRTDGMRLSDNRSIPHDDPVLGVNWTIDRFERIELVATDAPMKIFNPFGDIRLRASDGDELMIVGASQYSTQDNVRPVVDIREDADGVVVEVRFPSVDGMGPDLAPAELGKRRIDLAVVIPGRGAVEVESLDGLVEAKGVRGPLTVRSRSGAQRMIAKNDLDLRSEHGMIEVYFKGIVAFPGLAVETLTGDIRVEFPAGIDRTIRAETRGYLTTDFTATIEKSAGSPHKVVHVELGNGGDVVHLTSNLGMISILEQPNFPEPVPD